MKEFVRDKETFQYRGSYNLYRILNFVVKDILWFLPDTITIPTPYGKFRRKKDTRILTCMLDLMEPQIQPFLEKSMKRSELFIDVGAECGWYCIKAARLMERPRILAIEPDPDAFRLLQHNISLNGLDKDILLKKVALSDKEGEIILDGNEVETQTLDNLLERLGLEEKSFSIKIDIEGQAGSALCGMEKTLESEPDLIIKLHGEKERNEVFKCLKRPSYSYTLKELPGDMLIAF